MARRFEWDPRKAAANERVDDVVRIISARRATRRERELFDEHRGVEQ